MIETPDRPEIPHDPLPDSSNNRAKRKTRKLAEKGKLTSPGVRLPVYRMKKESPPDQPA